MSRPDGETNARPAQARLAKAPFDQLVLVCRKCARKLPGRGAKQVRSQLKAALKDRRWGKVRVVESRCLDLCPKRRQVLASARTLTDRRLVVVDPQFDAVQVLTQLLGLPTHSPGGGSCEGDRDGSSAIARTDDVGAQNSNSGASA